MAEPPGPDATPPRRRHGLLLLAGLAALGAGVAWRWRTQPAAPTPASAPAAAVDAPSIERVWSLTLKTPAGDDLPLARFKGRPLLVNFWATWCPPCVREMPTLQRFHQAQAGQGVQVLGLAIDGPTPVREFLAKVPVDYAIGLAGLDGTELVRALGNAQGGLPFTLLVDGAGQIRQRKLGEVQFDELQTWARALA